MYSELVHVNAEFARVKYESINSLKTIVQFVMDDHFIVNQRCQKSMFEEIGFITSMHLP